MSEVTEESLEHYQTGEELLQAILRERVGKKSPLNPSLPNDTTLPKSWCWSCPDQLASIGTGATPKRGNIEYYENGTIPWVTSSVVNSNYVRAAKEFITSKALQETNTKLYPKHTLLVALYGEGKTRGKITELLFESATNQALAALVFNGSAEACRRFVKLFFEKHYEDIRKASSGGVQPNLNLTIIKKTAIPFPPLPEQHRIVARIEEIFSRLDAGVATLRHAKAQLQRYRQSVLAAAVTGQLTQSWREQNPNTEPASELLERIPAQRRQYWNGKGKYKDPAEPKPIGFELPSKSWAVVSIDQLAIDTTIGLVRAAALQNSDGNGFGYLKMDKVDMNGGIDLEGLVYVHATADEVERFSLHKDDVLFNTRNSVELVGKTGHVTSEPATPLVFNNNLMRLRFVEEALPAFVAIQMCSKPFRAIMEGAKRATTSVAAVYGKDLRPLPIALPPLAEQHQIVTEVEARTTAIDHLEAELDQQLTRANRLRQSTLADAFSGNL